MVVESRRATPDSRTSSVNAIHVENARQTNQVLQAT